MGMIAVDWSGAKVPARKIWMAHADEGRLHRLEPLRSREEVLSRVVEHARTDAHAIVGLDFAFSMPAWFLRKHHVSSAFEFWTLVARDGEGWLKECVSPFWGRPGRRRPQVEAHYRRTEQAVQRIDGIAPKSCFQIGGAGAVGTGSIRGMPFLTALRDAGFAVWPFEASRLPLVVEIYSRILTGPVVKSSRQDRAAYLQRNWAGISTTLASLAGESEDAFDAAVSALIMDRCRHELQTLTDSDEIGHLEGEIWAPVQRAT